ncbi:hypothetical protein COX84_03240, partial [Candidatus Micrarchaeota archaeon CG_4_10_14_0_2_um_filter_49_7]
CQQAIGDNSRRDFHPQVIDDRSCRDMLQQEHLKSQQAKSKKRPFSKERGSLKWEFKSDAFHMTNNYRCKLIDIV